MDLPILDLPPDATAEPSATASVLLPALDAALSRRRAAAPANPLGAERIFHGFSEGYPRLVIDRYAATLVVFDITATALDRDLWSVVRAWVADRRSELGSEAGVEIRSVLWKVRRGRSEERLGLWVQGGPDSAPRLIVEDDVRYAVDLRLQADASFYLDTRELRRWLRREANGRSVLNTFAYTGSLGVAARAGGATRVVQLDRNPRFLAVAARSMAANDFEVEKGALRANDFFLETARLRREGRLFDLVVVDPPFFSQSERGGSRGQVDLQKGLAGLLAKVRPLIAHLGRLVVVDNAVFVSGAQFLRELEGLTADGYLSLEETIAVPAECGAGAPWVEGGPADPSPFVHSTKIAVLRARRKDLRVS